MYIYDSKKKTFEDGEGHRYYFYTGTCELDWKGLFIQKLLNSGYVPSH